MLLSRKGRVLVTALDWGLGHATRTSAMVDVLRRRGCHVIFAGSGRSLALLRGQHPDLEWVPLTSFSPRLSGSSCQWLTIGMQVPWFFICMVQEWWQTQRIVRKLGIDLIISDNRYGVRSRECASVLVTHQLRPRVAPGAPAWLNNAMAWGLGKLTAMFDGCLVPDVRLSTNGGGGASLCGALCWPLSQRLHGGIRAHRIGALSRLRGRGLNYYETENVGNKDEAIDWLAVVSGPEPQRGILVQRVVETLEGLPQGRKVVVCGNIGGTSRERETEGVEIVAYAEAEELARMLRGSRHIVCRSGYSTMLDLEALGILGTRHIVLIPTPGQAEQVYLAEHLAENVTMVSYVKQEELSANRLMEIV